MRIYVWGGLIASQKGWSYNSDLAFVASVLHDIGLLETYEAEGVSFEQAGGIAAKEWCLANGIDAAQAEIVLEAVSRHTTPGTDDHVIREVAIAHIGAAVDFLGAAPHFQQLKPVVPEVLEALPRIGFNTGFAKLLREHAARQPKSAAASRWILPFIASYKDGDPIGPWNE